MKMRDIKALVSLAAIIFLTFVISSYKQESQKTAVEVRDNLYGIPTYKNARLNARMSQMNGNPYVAVFMSNDSHETIVQFYKDRLKMDYKLLEYGKRAVVTMRVYQFPIEMGTLKNYLNKGVEIIPLNKRSQMVHSAKTKIKIILPRREVDAAIQKQKNPETTKK